MKVQRGHAVPQPLYPWETDVEPIEQEAGWAPGPVWMGAENLTPTGIQSLDCPALMELLYQPCCPSPSISLLPKCINLIYRGVFPMYSHMQNLVI